MRVSVSSASSSTSPRATMRNRGSPPLKAPPLAMEPMRTLRRLMMPSAGARTSVLPRRQIELAALSLDLRLLGLGGFQSVLAR